MIFYVALENCGHFLRFNVSVIQKDISGCEYYVEIHRYARKFELMFTKN